MVAGPDNKGKRQGMGNKVLHDNRETISSKGGMAAMALVFNGPPLVG